MNPTPRHVERALSEQVEIVPYDPTWPRLFAEEVARLRAALPAELIGRIEHFGSTAVPGLAAKPIIDMLVEASSMEDVAQRIAPLLQAQGYEFFWRAPEHGLPGMDYAWFIRRDAAGRRTHHIHFLEAGSSEWERLLFRDYLRANPRRASGRPCRLREGEDALRTRGDACSAARVTRVVPGMSARTAVFAARAVRTG
jgi:GrpB-like predicted nucleotidyltransferase (UPF0157 family)